MSTSASVDPARDPRTMLVIRSDGSIDAMASDNGEDADIRHAELDDEAIRALLQCAADSGFTALTDKSSFAANGFASGGKFCEIADAPTTTIALRAPSGELRTVSAEALGQTSPDCRIFSPQPLVTMFAILDQLRAQAVEIGSP